MDRQRLTITLGDDTLSKVDTFIDGTRIRNRSHAIEYLIQKTLIPKVSQAVILTGGKGLNMRPFTFEMPKGLLPVGGKPILEHVLELLRKYEIRDVIFSTGHLGDKIKDHFGEGKKFGVKISYVQENEPAGTAGALTFVKKHIVGDTFIVFHGDILIDINLSDLITFHKEQGTLGTIALTSVADPSKFGEVILHGSRITQFVEKRKNGTVASQLINCGVYVFEKAIFDYIPTSGFSLLEDIFPKLAASKELSGFIFAGKWVDVGTPISYEKAIKEWGEEKVV
jgi:NDP-sugar pyrophosphorylase family protein